MVGKREYGDYQTPADFAERVCLYLRDYRQIKPSAIIEPTCGKGNFLKSSLLFHADEYYGIEINPEYCEICKNALHNPNVTIIHSDFFTLTTKQLVQNKRRILILGNPPWVTNSTLSSLGSDNLPEKANFKALRGIDAMTGAGNFDICEYIILKLINEYRDTNTVISMLCKTSVARNVFMELIRTHIAFESCDILEFDASKVFGISASACILIVELSDSDPSADLCNVFDFDRPEKVKQQFGCVGGKIYSKSTPAKENFDGQCCFEWRQGVKHDCSKVMELTLKNGVLQNGQKQPVQIEEDMVFPLIKSSMFKEPVIHTFSKYVIVTQKKAHEETEHLSQEVPRTWEYLCEHKKLFENRKSTIYNGAPPFSMFGVGDYSYARYKVGVSGFYKKPLFSVLYSDDNKPVMTDDTSYFICFDSYDMAYVAMLLLNSDSVQRFLTSIAFQDAKRPYTKKLLQRIDFRKIVGSLTIDDLITTERALHLTDYIDTTKYKKFKSLLDFGQLQFA